MDKQKNIQLVVIAILTVAVLTMSVGFATFSQTLNITGSAAVTASAWNVHLENKTTPSDSITVSTGSQSVTVNSISGTDMSWSTTLSKPGDYAEFTINVLNEGTFDANLKSITMSSLSTTEAKFLKYEVWYGSNTTAYTATATGLNVKLDKKGTTATSVPVKVKVSYFQPTSSSDLPSTDQNVSFTLALAYEQATS